MKSEKQPQEQLKIELDKNHITFKNFEEIYFPNNCFACGKITSNRINKRLYGTFASNYDYKNNYYFSIPICDECENNLKIKNGLKAKSGKILLVSSLFGFLISIFLFLVTSSIFLSIGTAVISFILPFRYYKEQTKSKIKFDEFLDIHISKGNVNSVELKFKEEHYAEGLREINFVKLKEKQIEENNSQGDQDENE